MCTCACGERRTVGLNGLRSRSFAWRKFTHGTSSCSKGESFNVTKVRTQQGSVRQVSRHVHHAALRRAHGKYCISFARYPRVQSTPRAVCKPPTRTTPSPPQALADIIALRLSLRFIPEHRHTHTQTRSKTSKQTVPLSSEAKVQRGPCLRMQRACIRTHNQCTNRLVHAS